ncbi:hypothetical protein [Maridesulfovibrio sp.]|uniref:hypothetical protein n=1 Tax=Maridesulfovibrio sp. TaxID=2795000 RepID=UPI003B00793C
MGTAIDLQKKQQYATEKIRKKFNWTNINMVKKIILALITCIVLPTHLYADDVLKSFIPESQYDPRSLYDIELYYKVMEATKDEFGPFKIDLIQREASQNRDLREVASGKAVNVDIVAARTEWEKETIPIRIPILKGLLGIRLFLIKQNKLDLFSNTDSLAELKKLRLGSGKTWSITQALQRQGFNIVSGNNYDGLFKMLVINRFDYFPRGLNEIYKELELRKTEYPEITIEPTIALKIPLPTFFFVSPQNPRLAKRIECGLKKIMQNGVFDELFQKHFGNLYQRAQLNKRKIFMLDNPCLSQQTLKALKQ